MTTIQPYPTQEKRWGNIIKALLYFLLYEGIHWTFWFGASIYFMAISPDEASAEAAFNNHSNLLMVLLDLVVVLSLSVIVLTRGKRYFHGMGARKTRGETIPIAFIAGIGLSCVLGFLMGWVGYFFPEIIEDYNQTMDMTYNMSQIILYTLAGVVGAPLVEELIFRHFIAGNLSKGAPRWVAILVSSLLFGVIHQHFVQVIYAALLGTVMACFYFAYDSVLPSIALHAGFNAVSLLAMIDSSKWSEAAQMRFNVIMNDVYMVMALVGIGAMAILLVRRTHPVLKNEKQVMAAPAQAVYVPVPRPSAVEWDSLMAKPMESGKFPSVADLSAKMKGAQQDNAETDTNKEAEQ